MGALRSNYVRFAKNYPSLHRKLHPVAIFARSFIHDLSSFPRQILQLDLVRFLICFPKFLIGFVILRQYKIADQVSDANSKNTLLHNMRTTGELSAPRSHLLIRPIITIDRIRQDARNLRVLSIGPRVEGELLNLVGYGFAMSNIRGLDLFSYSRHVDVGDMHAMPYADNSFDIIISGWVIGYSDRKDVCANEMKRVCKPGGIIAVGNSYSTLSQEERAALTGLEIGSTERVEGLAALMKLFAPQPEQVYFRYDGAQDERNGAPIILVVEND